MPRPPEYEGNFFTIQCLEFADGSCPVGEFLDTLDPEDRRKLDTLFAYLGDQGKISNREKFKRLVDTESIFEFKSYQIRILCFYSPDRRVLLAYAAIKKRGKLRAAEIKIAEECRRWYLSQLGG